MKRKTILSWLLLAGLAGSGCHLVDDLPIGEGFSAKYLCSAVFTSGFDRNYVREHLIAPKVKPLPWIWQVSTDAEQRRTQVSDWVPGLGTTVAAGYRPGIGCTLFPGMAPAAQAQPAIEILPAPFLDEALPWPQGQALSTRVQVNERRLTDAVASAFREDLAGPVNTLAVVVVHQGRLVAQQYAPGVDAHTPLIGWSMTKTITALMAGILVDSGQLKLDAAPPVAEWQGTEKARIQLRHLLNMSSGMAVDENYTGLSTVSQMLYLEPDQSHFALMQPMLRPPGLEFHYSTAETQRLAAIIQQQVGGTAQAMYDFYQTRLFHPLGITSGLIEFDAAGNMVGGAYGFMSARDWARIGLLILQRGRWQGERLLSEDYMRFLTTPAATAANYGAMIWLNTDGARWPTLPHDMLYLAGHQGQRTLILPSHDLVIVRLGVTELEADQDAVIERLVKGVMAAVKTD